MKGEPRKVLKRTALVLALTACNSGTAERADRAAKKYLDKEAKFEGRDQSRSRLERAAERTENVFSKAVDVGRAGGEIAVKKNVRIDTLRMQHGIISLQPLAV